MPELSKKQIKYQRIVSIFAVSILAFGGLETLIKIANLYSQYQIHIYVLTALAIYVLFLFWLYFIFDLHFKPGKEPIQFALHYFKRRFHHFASWNNFRHFQNYLILPGMIYWGSAILICINFQRYSIQHFVAIISSIALIISYTLFKEIFHTKKVPIENWHFVILTYVKLYTAWLIYSSALGIIWYNCYPEFYFYFLSSVGTMMLLYQALFQFSAVSYRSVRLIFFASLFVGVISFLVFQYWNVNYFSAGIFLASVYNLLWAFVFHSINRSITRQIVLEHVAIFALITTLVFGTTNFKATIDRCGNQDLMPPINYQQSSGY